MKSVNPYLNFDGNTEEAFDFYRSAFGGEFGDIVRFRDMGDTMGVSEDEMDLIAHMSLPLGNGTVLMGTDVPPSMQMKLNIGNNVYIQFEADSAEEARQLFRALSDGGSVEMDLQKTEWAELYASWTDRYGVRWMVTYTGDAAM